MADGLNGPTNEEARELLEIRLEEAQARHAEDLERLERDVRTALCASMSECTDVAARRVAGERDLARAERDKYFQACENWSKLDAPLSEFRRVLRVGDYESTLGAARRMSRELEEAIARAEKAEAELEAARASAYVQSMRLEAASPPAPQGQPVTTDTVLCRVFVDAFEEANRHGVSDSGADRAGILAVAARVRAERPACLVARAVALGCDVEVWREGYESQYEWRVTVESVTSDLGVNDVVKTIHNVPAADVPATLARLLDEVEAARKAGAK